MSQQGGQRLRPTPPTSASRPQPAPPLNGPSSPSMRPSAAVRPLRVVRKENSKSNLSQDPISADALGRESRSRPMGGSVSSLSRHTSGSKPSNQTSTPSTSNQPQDDITGLDFWAFGDLSEQKSLKKSPSSGLLGGDADAEESEPEDPVYGQENDFFSSNVWDYDRYDTLPRENSENTDTVRKDTSGRESTLPETPDDQQEGGGFLKLALDDIRRDVLDHRSGRGALKHGTRNGARGRENRSGRSGVGVEDLGSMESKDSMGNGREEEAPLHGVDALDGYDDESMFASLLLGGSEVVNHENTRSGVDKGNTPSDTPENVTWKSKGAGPSTGTSASPSGDVTKNDMDIDAEENHNRWYYNQVRNREKQDFRNPGSKKIEDSGADDILLDEASFSRTMDTLSRIRSTRVDLNPTLVSGTSTAPTTAATDSTNTTDIPKIANTNANVNTAHSQEKNSNSAYSQKSVFPDVLDLDALMGNSTGDTENKKSDVYEHNTSLFPNSSRPNTRTSYDNTTSKKNAAAGSGAGSTMKLSAYHPLADALQMSVAHAVTHAATDTVGSVQCDKGIQQVHPLQLLPAAALSLARPLPFASLLLLLTHPQLNPYRLPVLLTHARAAVAWVCAEDVVGLIVRSVGRGGLAACRRLALAPNTHLPSSLLPSLAGRLRKLMATPIVDLLPLLNRETHHANTQKAKDNESTSENTRDTQDFTSASERKSKSRKNASPEIPNGALSGPGPAGTHVPVVEVNSADTLWDWLRISSSCGGIPITLFSGNVVSSRSSTGASPATGGPVRLPPSFEPIPKHDAYCSQIACASSPLTRDLHSNKNPLLSDILTSLRPQYVFTIVTTMGLEYIQSIPTYAHTYPPDTFLDDLEETECITLPYTATDAAAHSTDTGARSDSWLPKEHISLSGLFSQTPLLLVPVLPFIATLARASVDDPSIHTRALAASAHSSALRSPLARPGLPSWLRPTNADEECNLWRYELERFKEVIYRTQQTKSVAQSVAQSATQSVTVSLTKLLSIRRAPLWILLSDKIIQSGKIPDGNPEITTNVGNVFSHWPLLTLSEAIVVNGGTCAWEKSGNSDILGSAFSGCVSAMEVLLRMCLSMGLHVLPNTPHTSITSASSFCSSAGPSPSQPSHAARARDIEALEIRDTLTGQKPGPRRAPRRTQGWVGGMEEEEEVAGEEEQVYDEVEDAVTACVTACASRCEDLAHVLVCRFTPLANEKMNESTFALTSCVGQVWKSGAGVANSTSNSTHAQATHTPCSPVSVAATPTPLLSAYTIASSNGHWRVPLGSVCAWLMSLCSMSRLTARQVDMYIKHKSRLLGVLEQYVAGIAHESNPVNTGANDNTRNHASNANANINGDSGLDVSPDLSSRTVIGNRIHSEHMGEFFRSPVEAVCGTYAQLWHKPDIAATTTTTVSPAVGAGRAGASGRVGSTNSLTRTDLNTSTAATSSTGTNTHGDNANGLHALHGIFKSHANVKDTMSELSLLMRALKGEIPVDEKVRSMVGEMPNPEELGIFRNDSDDEEYFEWSDDDEDLGNDKDQENEGK